MSKIVDAWLSRCKRRRELLARLEPAPRLDAETLAALEKMSDAEAQQNAVDDPDAAPSTLAEMRGTPMPARDPFG